MKRWPAVGALVLVAGCGAHAGATPPSSSSAVATASGSPVAQAFSTGIAITDPPREPRPKQPVDPSTAVADARTTATVRALLAGCRARGWTECAAFGDHYLDGTGTPVEVDVTRMLHDLPTLATLVRQHQGGVTGWLPYACPSGTDWGYALGHVQVRVVGNRVEVADVYDFDPGTPFASFRTLADDGRAAEFLVTGSAPIES